MHAPWCGISDDSITPVALDEGGVGAEPLAVTSAPAGHLTHSESCTASAKAVSLQSRAQHSLTWSWWWTAAAAPWWWAVVGCVAGCGGLWWALLGSAGL
jgi:hypothetical protein